MTVVRGAISQSGQEVTADGHALVEGIGKSDLQFHSTNLGQAYSVVSQHTTTGSDENFISFQNTSSSDFFIIDKIVVGSSVANKFVFFEVTSGTPAGTEVTAKNTSLSSGNVADIVAYGNAEVTGSISGDAALVGRVTAGGTAILDVAGAFVMGKNNIYAISAASVGDVECTVIGHFRDKAR